MYTIIVLEKEQTHIQGAPKQLSPVFLWVFYAGVLLNELINILSFILIVISWRPSVAPWSFYHSHTKATALEITNVLL